MIRSGRTLILWYTDRLKEWEGNTDQIFMCKIKGHAPLLWFPERVKGWEANIYQSSVIKVKGHQRCDPFSVQIGLTANNPV